MVLPVELRENLSVKPGDPLLLEVIENGSGGLLLKVAKAPARLKIVPYSRNISELR